MSLHLRLERTDARGDRLEVLELPAFAGMEELVEQAHEVVNATGDRAAAGRHRRAMRPCSAMGHGATGMTARRPPTEAGGRGRVGRIGPLDAPTAGAGDRVPEIVLGIAIVVLGPDVLGPRRT